MNKGAERGALNDIRSKNSKECKNDRNFVIQSGLGLAASAAASIVLFALFASAAATDAQEGKIIYS
jgi:hypothetical protein